ncbi:uncharacterized protein BcabD6B2_42300 [Babesia caballi]|uniref:Uncharacterized protein n=1 Tax=Babesia caballi TaxID=5871 RepID=A0AAV4LY18_BABCB|nr:hypothetical protein, conserved [Babesia caballi]
MTTDGQKSLTQPPENLKEAIDWVIKIQNDNNAINDLAAALQELVKEDGSEIAMKVLDKYRLVSKTVIQGLEDANREILKAEEKFYFTHTALNNLSQGLKPFNTKSAAHVSQENVGTWVLNEQKDNLQELVNGLANGLNKFLNNSGILTSPSYTSAYNSAPSWSSLTTSDKRECAAILLAIMPVVYIGITYLYWQCEGIGGWDKQKLSEDKDLKKFLVAFGYANKDFNDSKRGQEIATQLTTAFSNELKTAYGSSQTHYFKFLKALQDKAPTPSTTSPLTSLYSLSHYYITNFLYDVQSTRPTTPSFLGYSGTAALAGGAYGFNLSGLGTFMSALLA